MMARLQDYYRDVVRDEMQKRFGYRNPMQIPRLDKVVLNMGVGEATQDSKKLQSAMAELALISGQKPAVCRARKSVANFKLREGMAIGCKVTLRSQRMYEFVDRLINIALPRVRDFRGVPTKSFDGRGNYTLGVRDHLIFPEIDAGKVDKSKGMNITIVTSAKDDEQARFLLRELGMPFGK